MNDVTARPFIAVSSITTRDGLTEPLPTRGVTMLVGPNNSGKSLMLRDISMLMTSATTQGRSLTSVALEMTGDADEMLPYLVRNGWKWSPSSKTSVVDGHQTMDLSRLRALWGSRGPLGPLSSVVAPAQMTDQRLQLLPAVSQVDGAAVPSPIHPLQRMFTDKGMEDRLSELTARAFGFEVCLNRYVNTLQLRVGQPTAELTPPPAPPALLEEYEALSPVSEQGDGVRAFVGLLLHVLLIDAHIMLIDEPEAFLHPPQARLLGRLLASESPPECQLPVGDPQR